MILTLSRMAELMQTISGMKPILDRSRFWDFGGWGRSMEMVIAAIICDVSRKSPLCSFTMDIKRHDFESMKNV